jgi:hypothetical protein
VCGARYVVCSTGSVGVGLVEWVSMMMSPPLSCLSSVVMYRIWGNLVLCDVLWFFPCVCSCGSIVICLKRCARFCRFLQVINMVLGAVSPSECRCVSLGGAG